jgi:hypothetical protein
MRKIFFFISAIKCRIRYQCTALLLHSACNYIQNLYRRLPTPRKQPSNQFYGFGMYVPHLGSEFFHPGFRIQGQKDSRIEDFKYFNPKIVPKLSDI